MSINRPRLMIAGLMAAVLFVAAVFAAIRTNPASFAPMIEIGARCLLLRRGGLRTRAGLTLALLVVGTVIVRLVFAGLISKGLHKLSGPPATGIYACR